MTAIDDVARSDRSLKPRGRRGASHRRDRTTASDLHVRTRNIPVMRRLLAMSRLGWRLRLFLQGQRRRRHEDEEWDPLRFSPSVLTTVKVADVPPPHHLFKCPHEERLGQLSDLEGEVHRQAWGVFAASLTSDDLRRCGYHDADWRKIAALSIVVLARIQDGQRCHAALRRIRRRYELSEEDGRALWSLFTDPIIWSFDSPELANGQHRVCALKLAWADLCIVIR
jgi:hypothetical protein